MLGKAAMEGVGLNPQRLLVTGHDGYIGTVLVPMLQRRGHTVVGLDSGLFRACAFGAERGSADEVITADVRDVEPAHLDGIDAVLHLAALSNDPLGNLDAEVTEEINHHATVDLAIAAKTAGVSRYLYSSSCSLYGMQGDDALDESAAFNPMTPYGRSKLDGEVNLRALADDEFSPAYLRNATAFGLSPRLRGDLVVNNLTGWAVATGQVYLKSDGTSWRPLTHIEDISRAFIALLEADRNLMHDEAFNVGATAENYRIRDVAEIVAEVVPDSVVTLSDTAFDDPRNYRVNCDKFADRFPDFAPTWTVRAGVEELYRAMVDNELSVETLEGPALMRVDHVKALIAAGVIDTDLRFRHRNGRD